MTPRERQAFAELLTSPLFTKRPMQDDEFSRGWNAAVAAMRALLERHDPRR